MKAITPAQTHHVNIDTTVQTKDVRYPTDARLYARARERLVKAARKLGIKIKQSYTRVGRRLVMMSSRYAHARQMKRAQACTRIYQQKREDKNKVYSVHEPEVQCIAKGKAGKI